MIVRSSIDARSDLRISLARYASMGIFLLGGGVCSTAPISLVDKAWSWAALALLPMAVLFGTRVLRRDLPAALLFSILGGFIGVGYFLKYALILHFPELVWGAGLVIDTSSVVGKIVPLMLALAPALSLYLLGLAVGPRLSDPSTVATQQLRIRSFPVIVICVLLVLIKGAALYLFDVGSPIRQGSGLPPIIIALLEFLCQDAMLVALNLLLYGAISLKKNQLAVFVLFAITLNVAISLTAGWKGELVLQVFVLIYLGFEFRAVLAPTARKRVFRSSAVGLIVLFLIYPVVNDYRRQLSRADSVSQALEDSVAAEVTLIGEESAIVAMFRRVSGISTYYASLEVGREGSLSVSALWDSQAGALLKRAIFGANADDTMVGFGASQFATLFLIGGQLALCVGALLFGLCTRVASWLIAKLVLKYEMSFRAFLPLLALSWINMMLAGGNLNLKFKELLVVCSLLAVVERLTLYRSSNADQGLQN